MKKNTKQKLLAALFAEAAKLGIDSETLREDIAPDLIEKRLSKATPQEVFRVIEYITGKGNPKSRMRNQKFKYESSREGLLQEIKDLAVERFGEDYIVPLNNLCSRFGESDGYRKMKIAGLKELKRRLIELQREDPW
jgi:gentisate 1,2-dioxygenase